MILHRFILTLFLFFLVIGCRTKKDISSQSKTWENIDTSDTTIQLYERINADYFRINQSILKRDGLLKITFDSITSIIILPDKTIQAIGFNPVLESTHSETKVLDIRDSLKVDAVDSIQATGSKKKLESGSEESFKKEVERTPSITPWIGAGLAIAIVVLAVLYYFFRRR